MTHISPISRSNWWARSLQTQLSTTTPRQPPTTTRASNFALIRAVTDNHVQVLVLWLPVLRNRARRYRDVPRQQVTEEAAAQGMTVVAASGESGAAGMRGAGYSGEGDDRLCRQWIRTSPFVTAVGGTDFFYSTLNPASTYWSTTNSGTPSYTSAKSYIPEQVWNDSYAPGGSGTSNNVSGTSVELAGGGGLSTAGSDGVSVAQGDPVLSEHYQTNHRVPRTPSCEQDSPYHPGRLVLRRKRRQPN